MLKLIKHPNFWIWIGIILACLCLVASVVFPLAHATPPPDNLWKGLIGEAVGEGYVGMTAVAFVYKNRLKQTLPLGCIALNRKDLDEFIELQGIQYVRLAKQIIHEVFYTNKKDITNGATHYENVEAFGIPYWATNMKVTCKIGRHTFYKKEE